ncbi:hypothetical protein [Tabrizicola aquatica]|jgi:hypothetical protein|nr:hypothetical protein [Tabrizicola aquatica]
MTDGKYSALNGVKLERMLYRLSNHVVPAIAGAEKKIRPTNGRA